MSNELMSMYSVELASDNNHEMTVVVPTANDIEYAQQISEWTQTAGTMLPKTVEEMVELFAKNHSVLIFDAENNLISHAAATCIYTDGSIEIGAMYTAKDHRGKGASTKAVLELINHLKENYPGQTLFALANEMSAKLFEKLGACKMEAKDLTQEVWQACSLCPKNPNIESFGILFHCCDTPYNLTNIG